MHGRRPAHVIPAAASFVALLLVVFALQSGEHSALAAPPPNDDFAGAITATPLPFSDATQTAEATDEPGEPQPCGNIAKTVWFTYTASTEGLLVADTAGSDFDTVLAAYSYTFSSPPLGLSDLACNDDGVTLGTASEIEIFTHAGQELFFQVGGKDGASGNAVFNLEFRPQNDDFNSANYIFSLPYDESVPTAGATDEPGESQPCGGIGNTVWYRYFAPGNFTITVTTAGSDFDTVLAAYVYGPTSPPAALLDLACNDDVSGGDTSSSLQIQIEAGREYVFQAGGKNGASGQLMFDMVGPPPGSIAGIVTDGLGGPIANAQVFAEAYYCCSYGSAVTAADGSYVVEGLLPVGHRVSASADGFVAEYYDNTYEYEAAQSVPVASGAETPNINFSLGTGGAISGIVTDEIGTPIEGAYLYAESDACCFVGYADSGPDGSFTFTTLAPGTYRISAGAEGFVDEYYDDAYYFDDAILVPVVEGGAVSGIVIDLTAEALISGVVTDENGAPIENAWVSADSYSPCCAYGFAISAADGSYTMGKLAAGQYRVQVFADGYAGEYYDNTYDYNAATLVAAAAGTATTGIDFALAAHASISGTVTAAGGGPIAGAEVYASTDICCEYGYAVSAADGTYEITGLAPSAYRVEASADGFLVEYYDNVTNYADATLVATIAGQQTAGIDFALAAGGGIAGTVTDAVGSPIEGAFVYAVGDACCGAGYAYTASDGTYTIGGLAPGSYRVHAQDSITGQQEFYDNVSSYDDATLVAVVGGVTTLEIDFQLPPVPTPTPTATFPPGYETPTPYPTSTPVIVPTVTPSPTFVAYTHTPTPATSATATSDTPTSTATSVAETPAATDTSVAGESATPTPQLTTTPTPSETAVDATPASTATAVDATTPPATSTASPPGGDTGPPATATPTATNAPAQSSGDGGGGRSEARDATSTPASAATATPQPQPVVSVLPATAIPPATPRSGVAGRPPIVAPDTGAGVGSDENPRIPVWLVLASIGGLVMLVGIAIRRRD